MKRLLCFILVALVCILPFNLYSSSINDDSSSDYSFSSEEDVLNLDYLLSLSPENALSILINHGLVLPDEFLECEADYQVAVNVTETVLRMLDSSPSSTFGFNYEPNLILADGVKCLLSEEIGVALPSRSQGSYSVTLNGDTYLSSYSNYNCYAYALGVTGCYKMPGCYAGITLTASQMSNVSTVMSAISQDLIAMGYTVTASSSKPTSLASGKHLICVRCASSLGEFHVMKAYTVNKWNHKPGVSAPLRLLDTSATSPGTYSWTNEMYLGPSIGWSDPTIYYNSSIWYFTYWL